MLTFKESQDGIMIALMLPEGISRHITNSLKNKTIPPGSKVLETGDHHITLLYFDKEEVGPSLHPVLTQFSYDLEGQYVDFFMDGIDCFYNDEKCVYVPVYNGSNTNGILAFQRELCTRIGYALGVGNELLFRYNTYKPHVTVMYIPKESDYDYHELSGLFDGVYISMESFSLINGEERNDYKFNLNI